MAKAAPKKKPTVHAATIIGLWRHGLIEDDWEAYHRGASVPGWRPTTHGRIAMEKGRLMLSGRTPD